MPADPSSQLSRHHLAILILALMSVGIGQSLVFAILAPLGREVQLNELQITSIIASSAPSLLAVRATSMAVLPPP